MKKSFLLLVAMALCFSVLFAQDEKQEEKKKDLKRKICLQEEVFLFLLDTTLFNWRKSGTWL